MLYPSIDEMIEIVDSKYTLVIAASRRARKLQEQGQGAAGTSTTKNVSRGLWELYNGTVTYVRRKDSLK